MKEIKNIDRLIFAALEEISKIDRLIFAALEEISKNTKSILEKIDVLQEQQKSVNQTDQAKENQWATVKEICNYYPSFSEPAMRCIIHNRINNGFECCIRRIGRKLLINLAAFENWIKDKPRGFKKKQTAKIKAVERLFS